MPLTKGRFPALVPHCPTAPLEGTRHQPLRPRPALPTPHPHWEKPQQGQETQPSAQPQLWYPISCIPMTKRLSDCSGEVLESFSSMQPLLLPLSVPVPSGKAGDLPAPPLWLHLWVALCPGLSGVIQLRKRPGESHPSMTSGGLLTL